MKKIQETLYIGQWCLSPLASRHLETSHSSPVTISWHVIFYWISLMVWNLFPFKGDFSFGKSQKLQAPNLGYREAETPEWFDVSPKTLHKTLCMNEYVMVTKLPITSCPIAAAFWIIRVVSVEKCSSSMQNLMQIHCSTHSVILNEMATQYTCHSMESTTPLTSTVKSSLLTHSH